MIGRIVIAVVVAFIAWLLLTFVLGPIIETIKFPPAQIIGGVLVTWGYAIAICIGLWYFFVGYRRWPAPL